jgi:hypothetical protein
MLKQLLTTLMIILGLNAAAAQENFGAEMPGFSILGYQLLFNRSRVIAPGKYWNAAFQIYNGALITVTSNQFGFFCGQAAAQAWINHPTADGPDGCTEGTRIKQRVPAGVYSMLILNTGGTNLSASLKIEGNK